MFRSANLKSILMDAYNNASKLRDTFELHKSDVYICDANGEFSQPPVKDEFYLSHKFEKYLSDKGPEYIISKCASNIEYAFTGCVPVIGGFAFTFTDVTGEETGWQLLRHPKPGAIYRVDNVLGELSVCGRNVILTTEKTYNITFVLSPAQINSKWVHILYDLYPGDPMLKQDLFGLSDGDILTYDDCVKRGITRIRWTCSDEQ